MERLVFNPRPISDRVDFLDLAGQYSLYHQSVLVVLIKCPIFRVRFRQPRISLWIQLQILNQHCRTRSDIYSYHNVCWYIPPFHSTQFAWTGRVQNINDIFFCFVNIRRTALGFRIAEQGFNITTTRTQRHQSPPGIGWLSLLIPVLRILNLYTSTCKHRVRQFSDNRIVQRGRVKSCCNRRKGSKLG